jgi:RNA polymerase sigma-70 factor (ECF subfamily)
MDGSKLDAAIQAAQSGDEYAFRVLYRAVQPGLLRYLNALVGADAEDVAAESWLQIARDLHGFRGDNAGFRAWCVTIARHRAMDHLRYQRRRPSQATPIDELIGVPADDDTAGHAVDALTTAEAVTLISGLPREQAEAVLLRVVVGLDAQATGRILGRRAGAVRTATYRGLRRLAQLIDRPDPDCSEAPVTRALAPTLKKVR